jgi:hypothetical protein
MEQTLPKNNEKNKRQKRDATPPGNNVVTMEQTINKILVKLAKSSKPIYKLFKKYHRNVK